MCTGIQVIQKSFFLSLENFVTDHLELLRNARIFIFGAGIRGRNLLWVLRHHQLSDIYFVDNNIHKQGTLFEDCEVLGFPEAGAYAGKHVFLCPVENGGPILEQLAISGRKKGTDYFDLDFSFEDYQELVEDLKRPASDYTLLLGCCELSSYILAETLVPSLGKGLGEQFMQGAYKLCALPGSCPAIYYHIINTCIRIQPKIPRYVIIMIELSSLSPYAPLMIGLQNYQQHERFIEQLTTLVPEDREIQLYLQTVRERLERSKKGSSPIKAENTPEAQRRVYKLKYMYHLRETDESVVYTRKILTEMEKRGIPVLLLFPPVDFQRGEKICGEEFAENYSGIIHKLLSFLDGYAYKYIDASFIAASDFFVPPPDLPDINPFLNKEGQSLLVNFLKRQDAVKLFFK